MSTYISKVAKYKNIYDNPEAFSNKDLDDIIKIVLKTKRLGLMLAVQIDTWHKLSMNCFIYCINER